MFTEPHRISIHRHYYRICVAQHRTYLELDKELARLKAAPISAEQIDTNSAKQEECYESREQAAVIGITFAAMSLEAFFYDYAARTLTDSFVKEHLDKLDLPSKLLIVPQLVCGSRIEKSSVVYLKVKKLRGDRNMLVHFKSKGFSLDKLAEAVDYHDLLNDQLRTALLNGVDTVQCVMKALDKLHGEGSYYYNAVCL